MDTKICNTCKRILPIENFHRCAQGKDGYRGMCKTCRKDQEASYRQKIAIANQEQPPSDTNMFCPGCTEMKPSQCFARNRTRKSGFARLCKDCTKPYSQEYRSVHRQDHANYIRSWRKSEKGKFSRRLEQKSQRAKYPEKDYARRALRQAVKGGRVIKLPCQYCGNPNSQGHHKDYSRPLDVIWVCYKHHREYFHPAKEMNHG